LWQETRLLLSEREYQTASVLEDGNDLARAEAAYRECLRLNPFNGRGHFGLSRVLYESGRYSEALREAVEADQTYTDSHLEVLRARILDQMGSGALALAAYRRALWLDPTLTSVQADIERLSKAP
jgi:tetratricopeptide (TPR) repeat protein